MKFNLKSKLLRRDTQFDETAPRLAGGGGMVAARQDAESLLRRAVMSCLLWEDLAYESGQAGADNLAALVPQVAPERVAAIAIETRQKQKLRHVPLWLVVQMCKHDKHKALVREVMAQVITRADQLTDLVALYWKANARELTATGKTKLPHQLKLGLADAFARFDAYQFAKYDRATAVKFRDVLALCHAHPPAGKEELYQQIKTRTLPVPDTWEVALSTGADKAATFTRLISERRLGNLALLRNLRGMAESGVNAATVIDGLARINDAGLLPLNFLAAAKAAPAYAAEVEAALFRVYAGRQKLPGHTVIVIDVSGSMGARLAAKSEFTRMHAGAAMAVLGREICERATVWATAGSDARHGHKTEQLPNLRGLGLVAEVEAAQGRLGGGGIFTRQCLEHLAKEMRGARPDRIIVFSDSQDCDTVKKPPAPFGVYNYIVDVSAHARGVNYKGVWTAEISGWSERFLDYIAAFEGLTLPETAA
jgi:60 kDa SS-A/Ro ribonucleoprotein